MHTTLLRSRVGVGDFDQKDGYLSIPQNDPDPAGRARRLSYRAPFWGTQTYAQVGRHNVAMTDGLPL